MKTERGYFGIGIYQPKTKVNVGTLWRSAWNFGAAFIFVIGRRYKNQCSDTQNTPKHIPLYEYKTFEDFKENMPKDAPLIAIELDEKAQDIKGFQHPERAIYLLGAEEKGIPKNILSKCHKIVQFATPKSLNVAVAGSIVMFHRNNS